MIMNILIVKQVKVHITLRIMNKKKVRVINRQEFSANPPPSTFPCITLTICIMFFYLH